MNKDDLLKKRLIELEQESKKKPCKLERTLKKREF